MNNVVYALHFYVSVVGFVEASHLRILELSHQRLEAIDLAGRSEGRIRAAQFDLQLGKRTV